MKALAYTLSILLSASLLSGCSQNQYAQQEYDDMYYTAQDRQKAIEEEQAREQARLETRRQAEQERQRQRELAEAERQRNAYDRNDVQTGREINPDASTGYSDYDDEYYEEDGQYYDNQTTTRSSGNQQPIYNNYYYNGGAAYDPYWNSYSNFGAAPWGWRNGFSVNLGWNSWNSWCDPFWDPWCGSAYYYNAYRPAWAWNGWGYHNSYALGYQNGFYDGFYGRRNYWGAYYQPSTVIVYNGENNTSSRNVSYGPRSTRSMAVADLGVGERASSRQNIQDYRRQRSLDGNGRSFRDGQQGISPDRRRERAYPSERGVRDGENSRTRTPRTEPGRNGEVRPTREPAERVRPSRPAPSERPSRPAPSERPSRPAPSERPSRPAPSPRNDGGSRPSRNDNGGGSSPSRSRDRGNEAPMQSSFDGIRNEEPAQRPSRDAFASPAERPAMQPRETAEPRERINRYSQPQQQNQAVERQANRPERSEAPAYNRPQPQQRNVEERQYSKPREESRSRDWGSNSIPQPARTYTRPAPQERSAPARTFSSPAPSRPAPSMNSGSSPSRSSGSSSGDSRPSRTRGGK